MAGGVRSGRVTKCSTPPLLSGVTGAVGVLAVASPADAGCGQAYPPMPASVSPAVPTTVAPPYRMMSRRVSPSRVMCHLHVSWNQSDLHGSRKGQGNRRVPVEKPQNSLWGGLGRKR